jgi:hypothetical protein
MKDKVCFSALTWASAIHSLCLADLCPGVAFDAPSENQSQNGSVVIVVQLGSLVTTIQRVC